MNHQDAACAVACGSEHAVEHLALALSSEQLAAW
jgi:hypothetical protein